jgi:hypothetical protein
LLLEFSFIQLKGYNKCEAYRHREQIRLNAA